MITINKREHPNKTTAQSGRNVSTGVSVVAVFCCCCCCCCFLADRSSSHHVSSPFQLYRTHRPRRAICRLAGSVSLLWPQHPLFRGCVLQGEGALLPRHDAQTATADDARPGPPVTRAGGGGGKQGEPAVPMHAAPVHSLLPVPPR